MSIALLKNPRKVHKLEDDLESLFWALVYLALHFVVHSDENVLLNNSVFGPGRERVFSGEVTKNDASGKTALLVNDVLNDFPFRCKPFQQLISRFALCLHSVYGLEHLARGKSSAARSAYEEAKQQASDPDWWIAGFEEALAADGWLDDDMVDDMFPPLSSVETQNEVDFIATTLYDSSHITATRVHSLPPVSLESRIQDAEATRDIEAPQAAEITQDGREPHDTNPPQDAEVSHPAAQIALGIKRPLETPQKPAEPPRAARVGRKKRRRAKENDVSAGPVDVQKFNEPAPPA